MKLNVRYLFAFLFFLVVEILIALYVFDGFIRSYMGDVLVVVVLYCLLRIVVKPYKGLPLYIFLFSSTIECAQYFNFVDRLGLSNYPILAIALGSTFDWIDILCYFTGCVFLFLWQNLRYGQT